MKRVLLVEDDKTLGNTLKTRLAQDYETEWSASFQEASEKLEKETFDLVILDVGLPDGSGFDLAKKIRKGLRPAFIFLTAQGDPETRLAGYELGAEEFIPKPFHLKELLLRVKHVLDSHVHEEEILLPTCTLDMQRLSVSHADGRIEYPPIKDMQMLKLLVERAPRALSRDEILDEVWGKETEKNPRTVDNSIARIRQLISDADESYIRSVRGVGYQWAGGKKDE